MKESVQFREETKRSLKKLQGKRLKLMMKLTSLAYHSCNSYLYCSTFIDPETRRAMGEQAVALSKAVGYSSAGVLAVIL